MPVCLGIIAAVPPNVAADEYERQPSIGNNLRDWSNVSTSDIDVENRQVELRVACQRFGDADRAGLGNDAVSELFQHFSRHHSKQGLVFNQKERRAFYWTTQLVCPRSKAATPL